MGRRVTTHEGRAHATVGTRERTIPRLPSSTSIRLRDVYTDSFLCALFRNGGGPMTAVLLVERDACSALWFKHSETKDKLKIPVMNTNCPLYRAGGGCAGSSQSDSFE